TDFSSDPMAWFRARQRQVLIVGGAVLLVAAIGGLLWWTQANKEAAAASALEQARAAADGPNGLAQSAGMLQRIIDQYSGTDASQEAVLTLAQVRMINGQHQLAAVALQEFVDKGPRAKYVAPARGLLGGALEGIGRYADAAENYMAASKGADLDVLKAQYLVNAARAYDLAGNREKALEALRTVVKDYAKTQMATEATVRLAELTQGAEPVATH
ncbi:MAG TPA: tetratricopeptide repeat protein, partial [Gemmatimonadales bacterium]|nr:tetratricopeptide repeat protein [Gemmatimonadales bacterium]